MAENNIFKDSLINAIKTGNTLYQRIIEIDAYQYFSIKLDCSWLEEPDNYQKGKHPLCKKIKDTFFIEFDSHNEPQKKLNEKSCLYYFEYLKENESQILSDFIFYKNKRDRNTSAIKKKTNSKYNILYVGKVKHDLGGRLSTHFGYANEQTGGLQLRHWIDRDFILYVHIIAFDDNLDNFINPLELELSKELDPLIGNSK